MSEKYYQLGTHTSEQWNELHAELIADGNTYDSVPSRQVTVEDEKLHSPTRGSYLLTDEEATALKADSRVKFINVDYMKYPETYAPPPDEITGADFKALREQKQEGGPMSMDDQMQMAMNQPMLPDEEM